MNSWGMMGAVRPTDTSRSSCAYGSGRNRIRSTTLNTAVVAPMPSASVRIAATAKDGISPETAQCIANIAQHALEPWQCGAIAIRLASLFRASECAGAPAAAPRHCSAPIERLRHILLGKVSFKFRVKLFSDPRSENIARNLNHKARIFRIPTS